MVIGGCKSQKFVIGDMNAGRGVRVAKARRRGMRHGEGFLGVIAALHPLQNRMQIKKIEHQFTKHNSFCETLEFVLISFALCELFTRKQIISN